MRENFLSRQRKFTPKNFFLSILQLKGSANKEGYSTALHRAWSKSGLSLKSVPAKSSLSEFRAKVSSEFLKDIFEEDLRANLNRRQMYKGHFIYAVDGDHLDLPASANLIQEGYRGYTVPLDKETHYPKMYTVQALDVVNGLVMRFSYSNKVSEAYQAQALVKSFEKNSIAIYDKLHHRYELVREHIQNENYFFMRVKTGSKTLHRDIQKFCRSRKRQEWIELRPPLQLKDKTLPTLKVRLVKIQNKRTKNLMVFMTNASEEIIADKDVGEFYQKRWGIESSFKDITDTLKLCQWHSEKLNGILQEIYALLWLVNQVRKIVHLATGTKDDFLNRDYKKANFKHLANLFMDHLNLLLQNKLLKFRDLLMRAAIRSAEKRRRLSRSYPRQVKKFGKKYKNASAIARRKAA